MRETFCRPCYRNICGMKWQNSHQIYFQHFRMICYQYIDSLNEG